MNTFQITQQIERVFPDIEGELCSKHSALLSSISKSFSKAYPLHTPTHFIVAKQPLVLVRGKEWQLEMAMQQGVTLMVSASDENEKMNIWTQAGQQIVLENSGKIINVEDQQQLTLLASRAIALAVQDLSLSKTKGGFIYLHLPVSSDLSSKQTRTSVLIAFFMAAITINDLVGQYSVQDLIDKLKTLQEFTNNNTAENYFQSYRNRELLVSGPTCRNVKVDKKYKFLFLSLSCLDEQVPPPICSESDIDELLCGLEQDKLNLIQLLAKIAQLQSVNQHNIQTNAFINSIQNQFSINTAFYTEKYCVFVVQTYRYTEIISKMSKMIHSKLEEEQPADEFYTKSHALKSRQKMQSLLFTSMPSTGVSIIDPSNAMWF